MKKIKISALRELITDAHMAGQHDAGCQHAGYSNALAHYTYEIEPKLKNLGEGEAETGYALLSDVRALNTYLERINTHMWETFMVNDFMTKNQCIEIMKILNEWSEHF